MPAQRHDGIDQGASRSRRFAARVVNEREGGRDGTPCIREAVAGDVAQLTAIHNHYVENDPVTFDIEPWTVERRRAEWFSQFADNGPHRLLVAEDAGVILGAAWSGSWRSKAAYHTTV